MTTAPAPNSAGGAMPDAAPLRSVHTENLPYLLEALGVSLLVSTYQAGKVIVVRAAEGKANTHFCQFHSPMGIAYDSGRLAVGSPGRIWEFRNHIQTAGQLPAPFRYDACFMPRGSHVTGNVLIHEMAWKGTELCFVNTRFSCLCTLDADYSFVPFWKPPFISKLAAEDRCHLNGLGLRDGQPRYVTAHGVSDAPAGWREHKAFGGCLLEVPSGDTVASGLSMPHSPRWHADRLWVLESGRGKVAVVDSATGRLETVAILPGFTRGVDFCGRFAFIGLSQVRETAVFSGIPITEKPERNCGVWVVDTQTGATVAFLRFEDAVQEIFSVQVLPGIRFPEIVTDNEQLIGNSFMLPAA